MARLPQENHLTAATDVVIPLVLTPWAIRLKSQQSPPKLQTLGLAAGIHWQSRRCNQGKRFSISVLVPDSTAFLQREQLAQAAGLSGWT